MTFSAVLAESTTMYILCLVTSITSNWKYGRHNIFLLVTAIASDFDMDTREPKLCIAVMIETDFGPTGGRVATFTFCRQTPIMNIICLMAGITVSLGILVGGTGMAGFTCDGTVQPGQGKRSKRVIKRHVLTP